MPRQDSKAARVRIAARWIAFRAEALWQYKVAADMLHGDKMTFARDDFDNLAEGFVRADGARTRRDIEALVARLSADELRRLAEHAKRKAHLFPRGRPSRDYDWSEQIERRRSGLSKRAKFRNLAVRSSDGPTASTRKASYYKHRKRRPQGE